ncbi:LIC_13246 family protein [Leptospira interrogans]|uniref:Uncharacterized protein n=2 Tax=Leptospira interrogans TaxID=173 RepID=A0AAP9WGC7_LEPIR|nr:hypothetical protein [Leptospira interrogans]QCO35600.1 hypothetical protein E4414_21535 [Leptospira interrogans]QOI44921.1 hypothetical protein Lepto782_22150 [Leptospira interrogans serovar Canicola]UMQ52659.1 hypothetical protein FH582_02220 [Leptospira interrogans]UMQ52666.1 hypothetical protein FH582_01520 [Leptospira interrogans]
MFDSTWKEVDNVGMIKFYQILKVLNCFYDLGVKNKRRELKNQLLKSSNAKIYLRKLNKYSYLVFAKIIDSDSILRDDWIHIDEIQEARDRFKSIGNLYHQVFSIPCLTEVYEEHSEVVDSIPEKFRCIN